MACYVTARFRTTSDGNGEWPQPATANTSTDVVIVGAGPAGLAAAIRLKQQSSGHCA